MKTLDTADVTSAPDQRVTGSDTGSRQSSWSGRLGERSSSAVQLAAVGAGIGMALIVGLDGSVLWRIVRLLVTGLAVVVTVVAARRWAGRRAALVAVAIAIVAVPVGATIGSSYLGTTGLSARAVGV